MGIRWFGNNNGVSAVTAASIRLSPVNVNGRVDVPIQAGGPHGVQIPFSHTLVHAQRLACILMWADMAFWFAACT